MIRSFYGLTQNPFDARELQLLPQQQEIHDTLKVHCQQGGHRHDTTAVIIYHKGQRMGAARLLDAVANGMQRRKEQ